MVKILNIFTHIFADNFMWRRGCAPAGKDIFLNKIALIYWSGTGHTQEMANNIAKGLREEGAECDVFEAGRVTAEMLPGYELLLFGCPACGEEQLEQAVFSPLFEAAKSQLRGKKVALFGSYGWGGGAWMQHWAGQARQAGAVFVAEPFIMRNAPHPEECAAFGKALAVL